MHGIKPLEYKILVKPDAVEEKTKSGLYMPETAREKEELARESGTIVAVSDMAFEGWAGTLPKVGDKVLYSRYAGSVIKGKDEIKYRLILDKDLGAIIE